MEPISTNIIDAMPQALTREILREGMAKIRAASEFARSPEGIRIRLLLHYCSFGFHSFPSNRKRDRCRVCNIKPRISK